MPSINCMSTNASWFNMGDFVCLRVYVCVCVFTIELNLCIMQAEKITVFAFRIMSSYLQLCRSSFLQSIFNSSAATNKKKWIS